MNSLIDQLQSYPFEKLQALYQSASPPKDYPPMALSIGEPQHPCPDFIKQALVDNIDQIEHYPVTRGTPELRTAICQWIKYRFGVELDAERQVIPVNGSREALFAIAQATVNANNNASVLMPNPFYQIYEGACILAGAQPQYLNTSDATGNLPDLDSVSADQWRRCQLIYLCNPGNPTGATMNRAYLEKMINLAQTYNFVIASDECYSEIYFDEQHAPLGLLEVAQQMGNTDFQHCIVFNSLSKRSNAPGLRSGFVAGNALIMQKFLHYRTYHGNAMPLPTQAASIAAWQDQNHVIENRKLYREKFIFLQKALAEVWPIQIPAGAFYCWMKTPVDDEQFALQLFSQYNIRVLPGSYLGRTSQGCNPGKNHVRIAIVGDMQQTEKFSEYLKDYFK